MKKLSFCLFGLLLSTVASAQGTTEIGLTGIPSMTTFHNGASDNYEYIFPVNYGIKISHRTGRFLFSSGILHLTQGIKTEFETTSTENPQGTGETFDIFIRTRMLAVPLNADYILVASDNTDFFAGIGLYARYIYEQEQEDTSVPEDFEPDPNTQYPHPTQRFREVDIFDDLYLGFNAGFGVKRALSKKISLLVRPNFLFQFRKELPESDHAHTNRLMSFNLDLGLYYKL